MRFHDIKEYLLLKVGLNNRALRKENSLTEELLNAKTAICSL